ncbi:M20 family metallopeptidase [Halegenticoccus tardaugens]|uniref:M20 family metallopeptidase n=1 Tax=Halegenticoccus tardaugens TaxID=2071624 RepID=UPI00100C2561|nr:M20 family metallopeptidase [Halegenticoccus tardaugens]
MTHDDENSVPSDEDALLRLIADLVARPSENPPGEETAVAEYLADRLEASAVPFAVETYDAVDGRPNVVARAGDASRGSVLLTGHTDVVPADPDEWSGDPYTLRREGDRIVGRGVSDMKAALAAELLAAESYLQSTDEPGEVVLGFVADEEWGGRGTRALVEHGVDADYAVVGEPTDRQICVAQKGVARYRIAVRGRSSHSGRPDAGINAIEGMHSVLTRLVAFDEHLREETSHDLLDPETGTVTEIKGGSAPNVVPDRATVTFDWRFLPGAVESGEPSETGEAAAWFDERLNDLLAGVERDGRPIEHDVERIVFARAAELPTEHKLVETMATAAADVGVDASPVGFNAATDARFLIHDAGVPTVLFGPGSIESDAHTVDESVRVADVADCARAYERVLTLLLE